MTSKRSSPYRAGVIGCGEIGSTIEDHVQGSSIRMGLPYGHAPAYRAVQRVKLVAGADNNAGRRRDFSKRWCIPEQNVYADYREMLERENLDIVSIATPTPLHVEMTLAAVEAGVGAIFLDKPVASRLGDAQRAVRACRDAGIPVMVNHTRRGDVTYRQARQLIDDGAIGTLHSLIAHFNGHLMWTGTHAFDLINYFNGDRPVSWMVGHLDEPAEFDPGGSAYIVYENGVRAYVNGSVGNGIPFRVQAIGNAGEINIGNYDLELWRSNPESPRGELLRHPFPQVLPAISPMVLLIEELVDAMEGGPDPMSNGETGYSALELIVGLHESSQEGGQRIDFPVGNYELEVASN